MRIKIDAKEKEIIKEALWLLDSNIAKDNKSIFDKLQNDEDLSEQEQIDFAPIKAKCGIIDKLINSLDKK